MPLDLEAQMEAIQAVLKLKEKMKERKIDHAWTHCPKCKGKLYARLVGRKQHIHARCQTDKCLAFME